MSLYLLTFDDKEDLFPNYYTKTSMPLTPFTCATGMFKNTTIVRYYSENFVDVTCDGNKVEVVLYTTILFLLSSLPR